MDDVRAQLAAIWDSLRRPMTSGQRQSALLIVPLTIALVLYGRPADGPIGAGLAEAPAVVTFASPESDLSDPVPSGVAVGMPVPGADGDASMPARSSAVAPRATGGAPAPGIVAVVRPEVAGVAAGDETMATAFLDHHGIDAAVIPLDPGADVCASVLARGSVVLAGVGLGPTLRSCLVAGGAVVIAYDSLGDLPPTGSGAGEVLSTRRGVVDGLVELAAWAVGAGELQGSTGLVTMESAREQVDVARPLLAEAGVEVTDVVYLPDDDPTAAISRGVLGFVAAGVDATVFVTPVAVQRDWVQQSSVVSPAMTHLVADAFDVLLDADYGGGFDGAISHTTLRFPWSLSPVPVRDECDRVWVEAGGDQLSTASAVRMYAWCQHAELAARLGSGGVDAAGLRGTTLESPITTALGPVGGSTWGPATATVVRWRADCSCWVEDGPTSDRTPRSR